MGLIAKFDRSTRAWYRDTDFELDLLRGYVRSVERLIDESIDIFHREQETHIVEENPDEGWVHAITVHHGVDDTTYSLDQIFEKYFPNLQRRSALITLFAFFEHQLDELCTRFAIEKKFTVAFTDLTGNGIERSTLYLKKMAGLPLDHSTGTWSEIKNIQLVRNAIAHNGGKMKKDATIKYVRGSKFLSGEYEITIEKGYLPHVIESFDTYFKGIHKLINPLN